MNADKIDRCEVEQVPLEEIHWMELAYLNPPSRTSDEYDFLKSRLEVMGPVKSDPVIIDEGENIVKGLSLSA